MGDVVGKVLDRTTVIGAKYLVGLADRCRIAQPLVVLLSAEICFSRYLILNPLQFYTFLLINQICGFSLRLQSPV